MQINVRFSAGLGQTIGHPRLAVALPDQATVADLITKLQADYPAATPRLKQVVPVRAGQTISQETQLKDGQEIALLLPVAGGYI